MIAPAGTASLAPGADVPMTEVEKKKLEQYIEQELEDSLDEHTAREDRINDWDRLYAGEPKQRTRNFPWPGAANIEVPLIGFTTDSIVARILNTIFSMEPFWTVRPLRKEVDKVAKPCEHYMDWSRKAEYNLYRAFKPAVIQTTKHGWGWLKYGWERYSRPDYSLGPDGEPTSIVEDVRRPVVYHVPNQDIIIQAGIEDERISEWMAHRVRLTDNQLRLRRHDKIYVDVDKIMKAKDDIRANEDQETRKDLEKLNTLYELQIDWPWGPDDLPTPMVVTWHHPTKTIARAVFNPYQWRPFTKLVFIEREGKYEGFGIARRLYQLQEGIGTIHRQRLDNATIANTRFFLGKRGQVRPGTQVWAGRFLTVNDPQKDVNVIPLGDVYPSMRDLEVQELGYAERASGISDPQLGRESQSMGSRATATGTLAMIQEGNRRFDLNVRDTRESGSEVGRRVLELNQRFRPRGTSYWVEGEDGKFVEDVLNLPPEFSVAKLAIELTASTATINKETEKQGLIGFLGVVTQYYERLGQLAMVVYNPQVPGEVKELMVRMSQGAKHVVDKIAQDFDFRNIDLVVPALLKDQAYNEIGSGNQRGAVGAPGGSPGAGMAEVLPGGGAMEGGGA